MFGGLFGIFFAVDCCLLCREEFYFFHLVKAEGQFWVIVGRSNGMVIVIL